MKKDQILRISWLMTTNSYYINWKRIWKTLFRWKLRVRYYKLLNLKKQFQKVRRLKKAHYEKKLLLWVVIYPKLDNFNIWNPFHFPNWKKNKKREMNNKKKFLISKQKLDCFEIFYFFVKYFMFKSLIFIL